MRSVVLSDHTGEKISELRKRRQREFDQRMSEYQGIVADRQQRGQEIKRDMARSWKTFPLIGFMWHLLRLILHGIVGNPPKPKLEASSQEEAIWESGNQGESRVANRLAGQLDDRWTLISGYRNNRGEIDRMLVGPRGICALEIKYINGVVHFNGDEWWRDKYDRYGNLVEAGEPIVDRRGRSPSQQLNDAASQLQGFLNRHGHATQISRVVVLAHDRSQVGTTANRTVNGVCTVRALDVNILYPDDFPTLDPESVDHLVEQIEGDHQFHSNRRGGRPRSGEKNRPSSRR